MQPELLPIPPSDETEEILKARLDRMYRRYGQNWRPFFETADERLKSDDEENQMPWWVLSRARQLSAVVSPER